jgi:hypothetical protein
VAGNEAVLYLQRLEARDVHRQVRDQILERDACGRYVFQLYDRQHVGERGQLRVDHYFGCIRMPASMRIDSAFMYELDSSSTASAANSVA